MTAADWAADNLVGMLPPMPLYITFAVSITLFAVAAAKFGDDRVAQTVRVKKHALWIALAAGLPMLSIIGCLVATAWDASLPVKAYLLVNAFTIASLHALMVAWWYAYSKRQLPPMAPAQG